MKSKIVKSSSVLLIGIALLCLMGEKNNAKAATWKDDNGYWTKGNKIIYILDNTLYESPFEPHSMGVQHKLASWKMDKSCESLKIITIRNNNAYVVYYSDLGKSTLYSVNIKNKKKQKVVGKCYAFAVKGKYIYGNPYKVSDTGAYPVRIWKIANNSVKQVKTIGKHIFGTTIVKNKVYYASYPNNKQKKMTVYHCNLDGTHRKKLFTLKTKEKYGQVLLSTVTQKTIKATVSGSSPVKWYEYNIKTGKLKKK